MQVKPGLLILTLGLFVGSLPSCTLGINDSTLVAAISPLLEPAEELGRAAVKFRESHDRWPDDVDTLEQFANSNQILFDRDAFEVIEFLHQDDGSLKMMYRLNPERFEMYEGPLDFSMSLEAVADDSDAEND